VTSTSHSESHTFFYILVIASCNVIKGLKMYLIPHKP